MTGPNTLSTLVNAMLMVVLAGYLLKVGQPVMLPILAAVIVVYVLVNLSEALGRLPVIGRLPAALRRFLVLLAFTAALFALTGVVVGTISEILAQAPRYQANIERLVAQMAEFLIIIYSAFLMAERAGFANKLFTALPDPRDAERTAAIIRDVNERIGDYLAVKTLINVLLGSISFVILWAMDVDFPLFWALLIGLLNYIPYVGSLVGVALPVLLSVVQFGELSRTIILAVLLTIAQVSVGNVIEPRLIGRRVNLSPFVVLVALAVWSSLWGVAGALLAVPLTSMLAIVLSAFDATRPIAILMADRVMGAYRPGP